MDTDYIKVFGGNKIEAQRIKPLKWRLLSLYFKLTFAQWRNF